MPSALEQPAVITDGGDCNFKYEPTTGMIAVEIREPLGVAVHKVNINVFLFLKNASVISGYVMGQLIGSSGQISSAGRFRVD